MPLSILHIYLITYKSHSNPKKLCLMLLLKTNNLIRSSLHFAETKELETTWYIQEDLFSFIIVIHIANITDSIISNYSLLLVPKRFSEPEAVHHIKTGDIWEVCFPLRKCEETWTKGRLTFKKSIHEN